MSGYYTICRDCLDTLQQPHGIIDEIICADDNCFYFYDEPLDDLDNEPVCTTCGDYQQMCTCGEAQELSYPPVVK
jgi:hypothetical protein